MPPEFNLNSSSQFQWFPESFRDGNASLDFVRPGKLDLVFSPKIIENCRLYVLTN